MKTLRKTLALIAALTVVATTMSACGKKNESSSASTTPKPGESGGTTAGDTTTKDDTEISTEKQAEKPADDKVELKTGGDTFTVLSWDDNDIPAMLNAYADKWDKVSPTGKTVADGAVSAGGAKLYNHNFNVGGGDAKAAIENYFDGGSDLDMFMADVGWARAFLLDDKKSAPLSKLGFKESDWTNVYSYTMALSKNDSGEIKGMTWQAAAGGYVYREDLAETYLNVKNETEMQAKVKDWDTMEKTAEELMKASGDKKIAMTATTGGMWEVYSQDRAKPWVENGKLVAEDPSSDAFLDRVIKWIDNGYVTKVGQWSDPWTQLGTSDGTMGYFASTWGMGNFILDAAGGDEKGKTFGKWRVVRGPQPFFWGGSWLMVNPNTDNGIEAKDFIYAMTIDEKTMADYAAKKGDFLNNKKVMKEVAAEKPAAYMDNIATKNLGSQNWWEVLANSVVDMKIETKNITIYDADIKGKFNSAIGEYIEGNVTDKAGIIKEFKSQVAKDISGVVVE